MDPGKYNNTNDSINKKCNNGCNKNSSSNKSIPSEPF